MIVVVMGVSGAGKSTIGAVLARMMDVDFLDADDFHPPENVAKMGSGTALNDDDRWPWLERLNSQLVARESKGIDAVLACSALKEVYRVRLLAGLRDARLVFLRGDFNLIRARVATRQHKYMPAPLLQSQFEILEVPENALVIDVALAVAEAVAQIRSLLPSTPRFAQPAR
jgi:gluconokinase